MPSQFEEGSEKYRIWACNFHIKYDNMQSCEFQERTGNSEKQAF